MIQTPSRKSACKIIDEGYNWSLLIFVLTLPVRPYFLQNILSYSTILFLIFALAKIIYCAEYQLKDRYKSSLLIIAPFIWWGIGLLYSSNTDQAFKHLETKLGLILIPGFLLFIHPVSDKTFGKILRYFALGVTFFLLLSYILVTIQNYRYNELEYIIYQFYLYHSLVHFIGMHATYMAIQVALASFIVLDLLLKSRNHSKSLIVNSIWLAFLLFALVSLTVKMVILGFLIALMAYILLKLEWKNSLKFILPVLLLLVASGYFLSKNDWFRKRVYMNDTELVKDLSVDPENKLGTWASVNMRYALADCAWDVITANPIFGTGIGDEKDERLKAYKSRGFQFAVNRNFNEHNQFLNIWLSSGIIGLIIFIAAIMIPLYLSIKRKDALFVAFIILILISFISENYLSRQIGVAFFAIFHALFWQRLLNSNQTKVAKTV